jgi:hypothetical protein
MKIRAIPITKSDLDNMPEAERAFFIHIGHLRNEVMSLVKMLTWSTNVPYDNPILTEVNVSQTFLLTRLLVGTLHEGWLLLDRSYIKRKLNLSMGPNILPDGQTAFEAIKKSFGGGMMAGVRNSSLFIKTLNGLAMKSTKLTRTAI